MMRSLQNARRTLALRAERATADGDSGFALVYVIMVTSILTVLVGSTLVVTAGSIVPSIKSTYDQAAIAAAQAGINAFVAEANTTCNDANNATVQTCTVRRQSNLTGTTIYSGSGYTASYVWNAVPDASNRYFRVTSQGTVKLGGISAQKTLTADIISGASVTPLKFGVVTGFETESPLDVLSRWTKRSIAFDQTGIDNATVPIKSSGNPVTVNWGGSSYGAAAGKVDVCNATLNSKAGRGTNTPARAPNPYVDWTEETTSGNHYTNFQPCQVSWGHLTELLPPVNPADGPGGYYSGDAMLLSNSYPGGTGPLLQQPVTTAFKYDPTIDGAVCGTAPGQYYRSFDLGCVGYPVNVGGSPSPLSIPDGTPHPGPAPSVFKTVTIPAAACVYNGPTRVKLNGDGTATVTSPQTTSLWVGTGGATHPSQCYTGAGALGMAAQTVRLDTPLRISVISVQNNGDPPPVNPSVTRPSSGTGWNQTGQYHGATASTSNSVFYLTNGAGGTSSATTRTGTAADRPYTPEVGDNPSTKTDGAWTPQWTTFSTGTTCSTSTSPSDLRFFNCYQSSAAGYNATEYSTIKAAVNAALNTAPASYDTPAELQAYLNGLLAAGNSSDAANSTPTYADNRSHKWAVTVAQDAAATDGCTPANNVQGTVTNTPLGAPSSDPFFSNSAGATTVTPSTTTGCLTATVTLQVGTCTLLSALGVCIGQAWGDGSGLLGGGKSVPQFKVTTTTATTVTTTTTTSAVSSFPYMDDVTQYSIGQDGTFSASHGPGDLYVEGTNPTTLALHAQDDVIVTGTLAPTNGLVDAQTPVMNPTAALEVVGQNDIRIYHPVKCVSTDLTLNNPSNTTPGWCPNDITGLYSGVLPNGTRADQQYTNMRPDLANLTINGAVFALGTAPQGWNCPGPTDGSGVCGGEFTVDNYDRGDSLGTTGLGYVTVIGTLGMAHHSPVGEEWEVPDTTGQTSRVYSGYQMAQRYQNLEALLSANGDIGGLLPPTPNTPAPWHIVSTSMATS